MSKNKNCSDYLGIHIAENVLSKVFKDVIKMPNNNPGYDFICSNGYKIDVKSACMKKDRPDSWYFHTENNFIADYFLCIAFDNREDLNPLHMWLIPSNTITNKNSSLYISNKSIDVWNRYEKSIYNIIQCCNSFRWATIDI